MNELAKKVAAQVKTRLKERADASPKRTKRYTHIWTQEQDGRRFGDGINTWAAVYELTTDIASTALLCKVLIGARSGTGSFTAEVAERWGLAIKRVWSEKASVSVKEVVGAGEILHTRRVQIEVAWNDTHARYTVTCKQTPGMDGLIAYLDGIADANARKDEMTGMRVTEEKATAYQVTWPKWKKVDALRDVDRDNVFHGTPDMLNWGNLDVEAVPHEFGHTIGLPDEYRVTKYNGAVVNANIYGKEAFTTRSIMNNTVSSRGSTLYGRHFKLIADDFKDLMSTQVKPGATFQGAPEITIL